MGRFCPLRIFCAGPAVASLFCFKLTSTFMNWSIQTQTSRHLHACWTRGNHWLRIRIRHSSRKGSCFPAEIPLIKSVAAANRQYKICGFVPQEHQEQDTFWRTRITRIYTPGYRETIGPLTKGKIRRKLSLTQPLTPVLRYEASYFRQNVPFF